MESFESKTCKPSTLPGNEWFWQNYNICLQWQERHKYSYWKSKALALEFERDALLDYIQTACENKKFEANYCRPDTNKAPRRTNNHNYFQSASCYSDGNSRQKRHNGNNGKKRLKKNKRSPRRDKSRVGNDESDCINREPKVNDVTHEESQLDQDLIEFFKQSMKHKMELKQKRKASEESDSATDSSAINLKLHSTRRSEEMRLLYGNKTPMIQGMETAMQLTFERNCDKLNPVLWPVLPLKI